MEDGGREVLAMKCMLVKKGKVFTKKRNKHCILNRTAKQGPISRWPARAQDRTITMADSGESLCVICSFSIVFGNKFMSAI